MLVLKIALTYLIQHIARAKKWIYKYYSAYKIGNHLANKFKIENDRNQEDKKDAYSGHDNPLLIHTTARSDQGG